MSTLTLAIVIAFILGYVCIAMESITKINKAAIALIMFVVCWSIYMIDPSAYMPGVSGNELYHAVSRMIENHLGDTSTTLFFLMGAMTIVEVVDQNGGFNFVRSLLRTSSKRKLLWRIAFLTFFLSAILDNLTTSIVMIMLLRKLVDDREDRLIYASLVVISSNSGGAFSPIGDVTTIMLWNSEFVTSQGVITEIFIPSLISMVIPAFIMQYWFKGDLVTTGLESDSGGVELTERQRRTVLFVGVGGLISVPLFHSVTHLPPFMGILLVLGLLWSATELIYGTKRVKAKGTVKKRVSTLLSRIDMSTILFFLGILMAVNCLQEIGVLKMMGIWLDGVSGGNHYLVTGVIGVLSSIVDNVPLVAGCMGMYPLAAAGDMAVDGIFWQLLAYCAGVGGSMLIIGSAAGVVVMGLEKITFGWYLKRITWVAFVGYLVGLVSYWVIRSFIFPG
ncbi:MAG: sodium:proton antiporter NhaD [Muribaculaceae bacterium]|nr:sodium:proton antiporter NhaD [Muribaculaceae bacterium]